MKAYLPTYTRAPRTFLEYSDLLIASEQRFRFHQELLAKGSNSAQSLADAYRIPLTDPMQKRQIAEDHASYYAYMMASLKNAETKLRFAAHEAALFLQRLRTGQVPISLIPRYFWGDLEIRDKVLAGWNDSRGVGTMDFETAFQAFDGQGMMKMNGGIVELTCDEVYRFCAKAFQTKVMSHIARQTKSIARNQTLVNSLIEDFEKLIEPEKEPPITLDKLEHLQKRSFPPCMHRIYSSLKKSGSLGFKGQFELSLFLKGLGLDAEQQEEFWKQLKEPGGVNIKAIYGDGEKDSYCPHSCVTMTTRERPKSVYQIQGCPFRYMAKSEMKMYLKKIDRGVTQSDIEDIVAKMPSQPQIACRLFFDSIFPDHPFPETQVTHPVEFFRESELRIKNLTTIQKVETSDQ